ncbi:MAG: hypothetical protein R2844_20125 [Caldilineales bacterium]
MPETGPRDQPRFRFDPVDIDQVRLLLSLPPGERVRVMLDAQALAKGLIMGRLCRQYPDLSPEELGFKFVEEIERAKQTRPGP